MHMFSQGLLGGCRWHFSILAIPYNRFHQAKLLIIIESLIDMYESTINQLLTHWIARLQICPYIFRKQMVPILKISQYGKPRVCRRQIAETSGAESRRPPRLTTMKSARWTWNLVEAWLMLVPYPRWTASHPNETPKAEFKANKI